MQLHRILRVKFFGSNIYLVYILSYATARQRTPAASLAVEVGGVGGWRDATGAAGVLQEELITREYDAPEDSEDEEDDYMAWYNDALASDGE